MLFEGERLYYRNVQRTYEIYFVHSSRCKQSCQMGRCVGVWEYEMHLGVFLSNL